MRKQSKFNLQYEIIKRELDKVIELSKSIEDLEIMISFSKEEFENFIEYIKKLNQMLLRANESLRENRKFVRKYISTKSVELSAQLVGDYLSVMYDPGLGLLQLEVIKSIDIDKINRLRNISEESNQLVNQLSESLEKLISPGIFSKIIRKFRKPLMFIEEMIAILLLSKKRRKKI